MCEELKQQDDPTKVRLYESIEELVYQIRYPYGLTWFLINYVLNSKIKQIILQVLDETLLLSQKVRSEGLNWNRKESTHELMNLEFRYKKAMFIPHLIVNGFYFLIALIIGLSLALYWDEWTALLAGRFMYYGIGLLGTVLYYAIGTIQRAKERNFKANKMKIILARLVTTMVACCIFMIAFDTTTDSFQLSKEGTKVITFFAFGYSIDLVIRLINRVIKKIGTIIDMV